jgi:hypothetical protein
VTVGSGAYLSLSEQDPLKQNNIIRQLLEGRTNNVGTVTLTSSAGSTTITSTLIGPNSTLLFSPLTANAASQMTLLRTSTVGAGTATVTHGNNANIDQTFNFVVIG